MQYRTLIFRTISLSLSLWDSLSLYIYIFLISEWGIALTGYVVPGSVEDGTWMLWKTSSVADVPAAVVAVAHYSLDTFANKELFPMICYEVLNVWIFWGIKLFSDHILISTPTRSKAWKPTFEKWGFQVSTQIKDACMTSLSNMIAFDFTSFWLDNVIQSSAFKVHLSQ